MTDPRTAIEQALDRVVEAARAHLSAIDASRRDRDDDGVWAAYVKLNNASVAYDALLNQTYDEVTPWELEEISTDDLDSSLSLISPELAVPGDDPHPLVVSVRQRRDYRVPSVAALLRAANDLPGGPGLIDTVAEAVVELLADGDGSLAMLDRPELEPLHGMVVVVEAVAPLDPDTCPDDDALAPFRLADDDRVAAQLTERPLPGR